MPKNTNKTKNNKKEKNAKKKHGTNFDLTTDF